MGKTGKSVYSGFGSRSLQNSQGVREFMGKIDGLKQVLKNESNIGIPVPAGYHKIFGGTPVREDDVYVHMLHFENNGEIKLMRVGDTPLYVGSKASEFDNVFRKDVIEG